MEFEEITATLKKLRREVGKRATPARKRERELYSALLDVLKFLEELDDNLDVAGVGDIRSRLGRLEEQVARFQERVG